MIHPESVRLCLLLLAFGCREAQPAAARQERSHELSSVDFDAYQRGMRREVAIARGRLQALSAAPGAGVGFGTDSSSRDGAVEGARAAGLSLLAYQALVHQVDSMLISQNASARSAAFADRARQLDSLRTELIVLRSRLEAEAATATTDIH